MKKAFFKPWVILVALILATLVFTACPSPSTPPPASLALDPCVFDVASGTQTAPFTLHVSNSTAGASIWYTIDGSDPIPGTSLLYDSGGISISFNRVVKAMATKSGMTASPISNATYRFLWASRASMPTARYGAAAAAIGSKIYVMGGYDSAVSSETLVFDVNTDTWSSDDSMPIGLYRASALAYAGKIYLFGGNTGSGASANVYRFDPSQTSGSRWSSALASLGTARYWASAALVGGLAYITGGNNGSTNLTSTERVDLTADPPVVASSAIDNLTVGQQQQVGISIGAAVYLFGGSTATDKVQRLDPSQGTGSQWSSLTTIPAMDYFDMAVAGEIGGKAYVVGGYWNIVYARDYCRAFDPAGTTVTAMTAMPLARYEAASAVVDGTLLVMGGLTSPTGPVVTAVVQQYDPAAE
jgi:N-acetylneuraminic acid mutarotase